MIATSIRRQITFAAGATMLAFAGVLAVVVEATRALDAARVSAGAAEAAARKAAVLERIFTDVEMSERAFVIAGDPALLAPYERAIAAIDGAVEDLSMAAADEPEEARRVRKVGELIARWRSGTAEPVIAARKAAIAAAAGGAAPPVLRPEDLVRQEAGTSQASEVRRELERFRTAEIAIAEERGRLAELSARRAALCAAGGAAFAIGVTAAAAILLLRAITRPLTDVLRATERLASGDLDERVPVRAADEVGRLAAAFNAMAGSMAASRREIEDRARTLQAILDHVDVGIALLDAAGRVSLANGRLPQVLKAPLREIEEEGGLLAWLRRHARRPEQVESWQARIDGDPDCLLFESVALGPLRDLVLRVFGGPVTGAHAPRGAGPAPQPRILVLRDATREAEADRLKSEFISMVSHELRTPLTSIRGYVDLVLGGDAGAVSAQQREFLEIVARNAGRLSALIDDILDVEKIHAGKIALRREPVDLAAVLESVVQTFRVTAEAKGLALATELEPAPPVEGDADRLTQVFLNLVSNAIKYTERGSVHVRLLRAEGEIRVEVRDTGIGLSPEDRGRVFERFFRADNRATRAAGGTGLGLAIAKAIVERHGARIEVASEPGKGSSFVVAFPLAAQAAPAPETELAAARR
jgi:signal transduction histidine kinase/CHASE3 domain sensor protein